MSKVVKFRPYKIPLPQKNPLFEPDNTPNKNFMDQDLERSGLVEEDLWSYSTPLLSRTGSRAAYGIPYFDPQGKCLTDANLYPIMYRSRFLYPPFSKERRYDQPTKEQLDKYGLSANVPYIHPDTVKIPGDVMVCCEGEKKTASVIKHLDLPAFGIGGCQNWRAPGGTGEPHPWILQLIRQRGSKVIIIPDGDIYRYDICNSYGTYAQALINCGITVEIVNPGGKIDDLIVEWGPDAKEKFAALPRIAPDSLVQSPASLAKKYSLAFKVVNDTVIVHQHTSNVMKLMEEHSAFPKVWRNLDSNRVMLGDDSATPDLTEMQIANYFQHNLGFDKITHRVVYSCIQALSKQNAKSPMLEYVRGQVWDGVPRLDSWLIRHWGIEDSDYTREVAAKWLISSCARMDKPGTKIDWMFIVVGPQATGKTSMPGIIFKGLNITLYGDHNDKDLHMLLHSSLCVGFDELDSFNKKESSNLKAMITRNEDAFRPPYGASVEIFPRRFALYGCGNRYEFLQHDPSGYRRYAIVEAPRLLDFAGLEGERDQLWAEAWYRYKQGNVRFWEVDGAAKRAEDYVIANPIAEELQRIVESWKETRPESISYDGKLHFTLSQVIVAMGMDPKGANSSFTREMSAVLGGLYGKSRLMRTKRGAGKYFVVDLD